MITFVWENFWDLMRRGGPVMWPMLALSIASVTLIFERTWFWLRLNHGGRLRRVEQMARSLRQGDAATARALATSDDSVYGQVVLRLLEERHSDANAMSIVESQRPMLERFMPTMSSLITGAPLLGLFGSVMGLISTFRFMSQQMMSSDPRSVGAGLSEALLNTAGGLFVALVVIFPYNAFRAQVDRTMGRLETLLAAGEHLSSSEPSGPAKSEKAPVGRG